MNPKRFTSKRTGLKAFVYRFTDPRTRRKSSKRFYVSERATADQCFRKFMDRLQESAQTGIDSQAGWSLSFSELVARFLNESIITSERRRLWIGKVLDENILRIESVREFNDVGKLTTACKRLVDRKRAPESYLLCHVQPVLRQLSRWAFDAGILPVNPLARWRRLPFKHEAKKRAAFQVDEVQAILHAAADLDVMFGRKYPIELVLRTLVTCGNRPGVMFAATVADLQADRIKLPPGNGKKRNGAATLPAELIQELRIYARKRDTSGPLLVSATGEVIEPVNFAKRDFKLAAVLAFVRNLWPTGNPATAHAEPLDVATAIVRGRPMTFDGPKPKAAEKVKAREVRSAAVNALVSLLWPLVQAKLKNRDLYAFVRKTHITLARAANVNRDATAVQVGHTGDLEEKFYVDEKLMNPALSSAMVHTLVCPRRPAQTENNVIRLAAGAEGQFTSERELTRELNSKKRQKSEPKTSKLFSQVVDEASTSRKAISGIRTQDLRFTKAPFESEQDATNSDLHRQNHHTPTHSTATENDTNPQNRGLTRELNSVAPDLKELLTLWDAIPVEVRAGMLATARAIAQGGA